MSSGFRLELLVDRRPLRTTVSGGKTYALAVPGKAFEVAISHSNSSTYMVRLYVDGVEAEPGYVKKVRPDETTRYSGYLCRRDVHEFLFADTPVDDAAAPDSVSTASKRLGTVSAVVYATRRVRVDDSSSDEDYGHHSSRWRAHALALSLRSMPALTSHGCAVAPAVPSL